MLIADFIDDLAYVFQNPVVAGRLLQTRKDAENLRSSNEFVWQTFITSLCTWGLDNWTAGSRRIAAYPNISSAALSGMSTQAARVSALDAFFRKKVRYASKRGPQVALNWAKLTANGTIASLCATARALPDRDAKRAFLRTHYSLLLHGEKYGRNYWMDLYDPDFRDCFAIDARIVALLVQLADLPPAIKALMLNAKGEAIAPSNPRDYKVVEDFLNTRIVAPLAARLGRKVGSKSWTTDLSSWQVDRLMWATYNMLSTLMSLR